MKHKKIRKAETWAVMYWAHNFSRHQTLYLYWVEASLAAVEKMLKMEHVELYQTRQQNLTQVIMKIQAHLLWYKLYDLHNQIYKTIC